MDSASVFPNYDKIDKGMAAFYFLVGYGFVYLFLGATKTWSLAVFTVFYAAVVLAYLKLKGQKPPAESWFWLTVLLAIGLPFAFWSVLHGLQFLALLAVAAYWTLSASGRLLQKGRTSEWIAFDCWNAFLWVPFSNFICQARVLFERKSEEETKEQAKEQKGLSLLLGIGLALPVLAIVLPLLSRADAGFESLMGEVVRYIQENLLLTFWRIVLSIPVSLYLYGLIFGGVTGRNTDCIKAEQIQETRNRARCLPNMTVCTVLVALGLLYLLFIGLQGNYLFAAFTGRLPEEFTYAEYARRGFFELCQIGAWNLVILGVSGVLAHKSRQEHKGLRFLTITLSVMTLLLIVTAISKLSMYIDIYGLTVNRILPMVFMIWLFLVFICMILRQTEEFPMVRICVMAGAVLFCLLCVFPVEDWVDAYNAWARMNGYIL